mmetsp:Transcript_5851/g.10143  ORF Transcript_5851/g.10143 Transcript_5851/m.10143 type:complete len:225 (-) Transcript_5851:52-726(-)
MLVVLVLVVVGMRVDGVSVLGVEIPPSRTAASEIGGPFDNDISQGRFSLRQVPPQESSAFGNVKEQIGGKERPQYVKAQKDNQNVHKTHKKVILDFVVRFVVVVVVRRRSLSGLDPEVNQYAQQGQSTDSESKDRPRQNTTTATALEFRGHVVRCLLVLLLTFLGTRAMTISKTTRVLYCSHCCLGSTAITNEQLVQFCNSMVLSLSKVHPVYYPVNPQEEPLL